MNRIKIPEELKSKHPNYESTIARLRQAIREVTEERTLCAGCFSSMPEGWEDETFCPRCN